MTDQETIDLSVRLASTWRTGGHPADQWALAIRNLDAGSVGTCLVRLQSSSTSPSIETFLHEYAKLRTEHTDPRWQESCPHDKCSGDGWINVEYQIVTTPGHIDGKPDHDPVSRTARAVKPCTCPMGQSHVDLYERMAR